MTKKQINQTIDAAAEDLSDAQRHLAGIAQTMDDLLEERRKEILATYREDIKSAVRVVKDRRIKLSRLLDANKDCFKSPKSRVVGLLKIGFRKSAGKLVYEGKEEDMIERIKKRFGKDAAVSKGLLVRKDSLVVKRIKELPANVLAGLRARIDGAVDKPVCDVVQSEIEAAIDRWVQN